MTDRELKKWNQEAEDRLVKALECCINDKPCRENQCPFHENECENDVYALEKHALDLINSQKAEIKRLTEENDILNGIVDRLVKESKGESNG